VRDNLQAKPAGVNYSPDLIRTIAIVMVIFVHCSGFPYRFLGSQITTTDVMNWFTTDVYAAFGYLGVPLFVMLSGALLLDPAKADEPMRVFFKKRFNRIAFPMIFWTIVYFAWSVYVRGKPFTPYNISQGLLMGSSEILWYLYLIVGLYLVTPILRVLIKHIDKNKFTLLIIVWFVGTVCGSRNSHFHHLQLRPSNGGYLRLDRLLPFGHLSAGE
jgi:surface polysaccharide O-acyltransferase-like enzyme